MKSLLIILLLFYSTMVFGQTSMRNGLIDVWRMENNANGVKGNNGTPTDITYTTGKKGNAAVLNGTSSKIDLGDISLSYPFSVSAWVKHNGTTANSNIVSVSSGTDAFYHTVFLDYNGGVNDNIVIRSYDGTVRDDAYQYNFTSSEWLHIVAIWVSATSRKLYFNGNLVASGTISVSGIGFDNSTIGVSADNTPTNYFGGNIDEVTVAKREYTTLEVKNLYNSGDGILMVYENYLKDGDYEKFDNYAKEYFALNK